MLPDLATASLRNNVTCRASSNRAGTLVNFNALRLGRGIDTQFPIRLSQARDGGRAQGCQRSRSSNRNALQPAHSSLLYRPLQPQN
jgi:hypothetical protein